MSEFTVRDVWDAVQRARFDTGIDAVRVSHRTMDDLRRSFSRDAPPPGNVLPAVAFGTRLIIDPTVPDGVLAPVERVSTAQPTDPASPDAMRLDASQAEADAELAEWRALLDGAKGRRRG